MRLDSSLFFMNQIKISVHETICEDERTRKFPYQRQYIWGCMVIKMQWFGLCALALRLSIAGPCASCRRLPLAYFLKYTYNFVQTFMPVHTFLWIICISSKPFKVEVIFWATPSLWLLCINYFYASCLYFLLPEWWLVYIQNRFLLL